MPIKEFNRDDITKGNVFKTPTQDGNISARTFSKRSGQAPFETLFHDFNLEAIPFYNFWTSDELTNDTDERGDRKLEDVPRFIKVVWNVAPDLWDEGLKIEPRSTIYRPVDPVMFFQEIERKNVTTLNGITFTPEHIQSSGFSKLKGIVANGYLAPGVLETVIDMPLSNTGIETQRVHSLLDNRMHTDEDAFLNDPSTVGLSIHELKAQAIQLTSGDAVITRPLDHSGLMRISSGRTDDVSISFFSMTATPAKKMISDDVVDLMERVSQPESVSSLTPSTQIKVKFFNPAIGGLLDENKINLVSSPEHVENIIAIAPQLANFEILSQTTLYDSGKLIDIPSLPTPRLKNLEYIGYVIEKYAQQRSGAFIKIDEIDVPSREIDTFIDTRILYGETYRYRIRALLRWTRPIGFDEKDRSESVITRNGTATASSNSYKSSYLFGEWGHRWAYGTCIDIQPPPPPDELTVRPESHRKRVVITFKLPDNSQRDILKMMLMRKVQDESGRDLSDWAQVVVSSSPDRSTDFAPKNVIFFDTDVDFFQRSRLKYVYAAQCISRHDERSTLSEQLVARLNEDYFSRGEYSVEFLSSAGVRPEYFGSFSTRPPRITKTDVIISPPPVRPGGAPGVAAVIFTGRENVGNTFMLPASYICRVQSLDTGEMEDIPIEVSYRNIQSRVEVSRFDFHVPTHTISGKNSDQFNDRQNMILKMSLSRYQDVLSIDTSSEDEQTHVYDRPAPGDIW